MNQLEMIPGTNRDTSRSQYFTPPKLAQRVAEWAELRRFDACGRAMTPRVLEPSAGNGALVRPLVAAGAWVSAVELDDRYRQDLIDAGAQDRWVGQDFLSVQKSQPGFTFDLCVGNFPYHDNLAAEFTLHALKFAPRVVAIYQADIWYTVTRREELWTKARPSRIANLARRPWPGETDYVVAEIVKRDRSLGDGTVVESCTVEWWPEAWRR